MDGFRVRWTVGRKQQLWEVEGGGSWGAPLQVSLVLEAALSVLLFPNHHEVSSLVPHTPCHEVLPNRNGAGYQGGNL